MSNQAIELTTSEAVRRGDRLMAEIRYEDYYRGALHERFPECDAVGIVDRFRMRGHVEAIRTRQILNLMKDEVLRVAGLEIEAGRVG